MSPGNHPYDEIGFYLIMNRTLGVFIHTKWYYMGLGGEKNRFLVFIQNGLCCDLLIPLRDFVELIVHKYF
jgi:hypothetical protein